MRLKRAAILALTSSAAIHAAKEKVQITEVTTQEVTEPTHRTCYRDPKKGLMGTTCVDKADTENVVTAILLVSNRKVGISCVKCTVPIEGFGDAEFTKGKVKLHWYNDLSKEWETQIFKVEVIK